MAKKHPNGCPDEAETPESLVGQLLSQWQSEAAIHDLDTPRVLYPTDTNIDVVRKLSYAVRRAARMHGPVTPQMAAAAVTATSTVLIRVIDTLLDLTLAMDIDVERRDQVLAEVAKAAHFRFEPAPPKQ